MTSPWNNDRVGIRFNEKMQAILDDEFIEYLENQYEGVTDFFEKALKEEKKNKPSLDQRIQELDNKEQQIQDEKQRLIEKKRERQRENKLEKKKRKLKDLQKELMHIKSEGLTTREDAVEEVVEELSERDRFDGESESELRSELGEENFERNVDRRVDDVEKVEDLADRVSSLQDDVAELNGGSYDWFIEADQVLEVAL